MKKLLSLLAVSPLVLTACGGGGGDADASIPIYGDKSNLIDAKVERDNDEKATADVKAAFKAMLTAATGKTYDSTDGALLTFNDGKTLKNVDAMEGNWYGDSDSLFSDSDIDDLTMAQAYRAAIYFATDTFQPFTNIGSQNGTLLNGMLANGVEFGEKFSAAAYFPMEARVLVNAIKEANGDDGWYKLDSYQNAGAREDIATLMQANLELVGITMGMQTTDWPTHLEKTYAGEHGTYVGGWTTVTGHAGYGLWGPFHTSAAGSGGNRQFVSDSTIDAALEAAQWANATEAGNQYDIAQKRVAQLFPTIPLYSSNRRFAGQNIKGGLESLDDKGIIQKAAHHDFGGIEVTHDDGIFRTAVTGAHASLHPHGSNDSASTLINKHIYQSLWKQNSDGLSTDDTKFESLLISEDIDNVEIKDGRVALTVDSNAKWSDGSALTAAEIVDSINRAIGEPQIAGVTPGVLGAQETGTTGEFEILFGEPDDGVEEGTWIDDQNKIDETDLDVKDFSAWKQTIAHAGFAINRIKLENHDDGTDGGTSNVIGTGRYTLTSISANDDVVLTAITDHWSGDSAKNKAIDITVVADTTAMMLAFTSDEIDFADAVPTADWNELDADERGDFATFSNNFIGINTAQADFTPGS